MSGLCPFHPEKTASFSVSPSKQVYFCFGCGEGGNVFRFVEKIENLSFPEVVERLARETGVTLRYEGESETTRRAARQLAVELKADDSIALVDTIPHWPPFPDVGPGQAIHALVFGRQPDPADAVQKSDAARKNQPQPNDLGKLLLRFLDFVLHRQLHA